MDSVVVTPRKHPCLSGINNGTYAPLLFDSDTAPRLAAAHHPGYWRMSIVRRCDVPVSINGVIQSFQLVSRATKTAWALFISADLISELESSQAIVQLYCCIKH